MQCSSVAGLVGSVGAEERRRGVGDDLEDGFPHVGGAVALQALQTPPMEIAAIFESLREVGALAAEIVIR